MIQIGKVLLIHIEMDAVMAKKSDQGNERVKQKKRNFRA